MRNETTLIDLRAFKECWKNLDMSKTISPEGRITGSNNSLS